jgi:hypothetical protein
VGSLKIDWTAIAKGGVKPLTIIEHHHTLENDQSRRFARGKVIEFGTFSAQGAENCFT